MAVVSLVDTNRVWYKSVHGPFPSARSAGCPGSAPRRSPTTAPMWWRTRAPIRAPRSIRWWPGPSGSSSTWACRSAPTTGMRSACSPAWTRGRAGVVPQQLRYLETLAAIVMDEIELRRSASQISRLSEALADACTDLERRASFDPLTGVLARTAMLERSAALIARALAGAKGAAVLMLDIDRFKAINDALRACRGRPGAEGGGRAHGRELPRRRPARAGGGRGVPGGLRRCDRGGGGGHRRAAARSGGADAGGASRRDRRSRSRSAAGCSGSRRRMGSSPSRTRCRGPMRRSTGRRRRGGTGSCRHERTRLFPAVPRPDPPGEEHRAGDRRVVVGRGPDEPRPLVERDRIRHARQGIEPDLAIADPLRRRDQPPPPAPRRAPRHGPRAGRRAASSRPPPPPPSAAARRTRAAPRPGRARAGARPTGGA